MTRPAQLPGHSDQPRLRCCKLLTPARLACQSVQYPSSMTVPVHIVKEPNPQTGNVLAGLGLATSLAPPEDARNLLCIIISQTASQRGTMNSLRQGSTCCAALGPTGLESAGLLAL